MGENLQRSPGLSRPPGRDADRIRRMFASIAHRYDLLNRLLSCRRDRHWRRVTVRRLSSYLSHGGVILDLCTGTADLALELALQGRVVGCDFCHAMLVRGVAKARRGGPGSQVRLVEGDALHLPFASGAFDAVTIAFGLRNLVDLGAGLAEMHRILRPGGVMGILEFSQPTTPVFRQVYLFYFHQVLPRLGAFLSGDGEAYSYLPRSVGEFPDPESLEKMIESAGFQVRGRDSLTGGIVTLHLAQKAAVAAALR